MMKVDEIIQALQKTNLTPEQSVLVKQLANTSGSNVRDIKSEILFLLEQESRGDTIKVDEVKSIIARAGNDL